jgi:hypothetical protein
MKFAIIVVNINTCRIIEPLKLAFLAQVTYNQPNSHTSRKNAKRKTIAIGVLKIVWLVKQPLHSINKKSQQKPSE